MAFYLIDATLQFLFFPPVAAVAFSALLLYFPCRLFSEIRLRLRELWMLILLAFPPILIAYGTEFEGAAAHLPEWNWTSGMILLILGLQLVVSGILIWKLRGMRMACVCFAVFAMCPSLGAALEATMCVTDRWL